MIAFAQQVAGSVGSDSSRRNANFIRDLVERRISQNKAVTDYLHSESGRPTRISGVMSQLASTELVGDIVRAYLHNSRATTPARCAVHTTNVTEKEPLINPAFSDSREPCSYPDTSDG